MTRLFALIFVVLIALSVVALAMQPPSNAHDGHVHLVWVTDDNPARHAQMDLFERLNPNIDISIDPSNSGLDKIIVQAQAGVGPDLFDCYGPDQLYAFAQSGIAWNVTQPLAERGIDSTKDIWPVAESTCAQGKQVYGFPTNAVVYATWLNTDAFSKSGIPLPHKPGWTWDDFLPVAEKLTLRDPQSGRVTQWGVLLDYSSWRQFVEQWGGSIYSPEGTRCTVDTPQAVKGLQFLHDLIYKYRVAPSPTAEDAMATSGGWGIGPTALFSAGRGAMAIGGRYWLVTLRTVPGLHLSAAECPHPVDGRRVYYGAARATMINAKSPNREAALKFLQFLAGEPYNRLINQQADGVCAMKQYSSDDPLPAGASASDAAEEDIDVWRSVMPYGTGNATSPFIDPDAANVIFQKQIDLILADQKPVGAAMRDAATQVNAVIEENISRDPQMRDEYNRAKAGSPGLT